MHTTDSNIKNDPSTNKTKDSAGSFAKKVDPAANKPEVVAPGSEDKAKEPSQPAADQVCTDASKKLQGTPDNAVKPKSESESSNPVTKPTDKNAGYQVQVEPHQAGHVAPTMGSKAENAAPKQQPKATDKSPSRN